MYDLLSPPGRWGEESRSTPHAQVAGARDFFKHDIITILSDRLQTITSVVGLAQKHAAHTFGHFLATDKALLDDAQVFKSSNVWHRHNPTKDDRRKPEEQALVMAYFFLRFLVYFFTFYIPFLLFSQIQIIINVIVVLLLLVLLLLVPSLHLMVNQWLWLI